MFNSNETLNMIKKPASKPQDWHAIDIVAAVRKTGTSIQRLSRLNGYADDSLRACLYKPMPKMERVIAGHLGVNPQTIWPTRYHLDGSPKSGRGERGIGRHPSRLSATLKDKANHTTTVKSCNVNALDKVAA